MTSWFTWTFSFIGSRLYHKIIKFSTEWIAGCLQCGVIRCQKCLKVVKYSQIVVYSMCEMITANLFCKETFWVINCNCNRYIRNTVSWQLGAERSPFHLFKLIKNNKIKIYIQSENNYLVFIWIIKTLNNGKIWFQYLFKNFPSLC